MDYNAQPPTPGPRVGLVPITERFYHDKATDDMGARL